MNSVRQKRESVRRVYAASVSGEWRRLKADSFRRLEWETTRRFLRRYLPKRGLVLDAGGGPGRYAIQLGRWGYDVSLLDLVSENLDFAKRRVRKEGVGPRIKEFVKGSITDLAMFKAGTFDAVLCLGGPLSHVYSESARRKAISELVRVARRGAPIFVSVMSKWGVLLATPSGWPQEAALGNFRSFVRSGDDNRWCGKSYCHFFTSDELGKLLMREKVRIVERIGLEGLNINQDTTSRFAKYHPKAWKAWLAFHRKNCTESFVVDASNHMLFVVKKK